METFKSTINPKVNLTVGRFAHDVNLTTTSGIGMALGINIANEDAPALALAILEAAGVKGNMADDIASARAMDYLRGVIERREHEAEEAARAAAAKLTDRRNKYVRDIYEKARFTSTPPPYDKANYDLRAAVDLLIERDDELIQAEAGK